MEFASTILLSWSLASLTQHYLGAKEAVLEGMGKGPVGTVFSPRVPPAGYSGKSHSKSDHHSELKDLRKILPTETPSYRGGN